MPTRKPTLVFVRIPLLLAGALLTAVLSSCATDRFETAPPSGIDLTGEWNLNVNLSDDPDRLGDVDKTPPREPTSTTPRSHGGMGRGGGAGGVPPIGSPPDGGPNGGGDSNFLPLSYAPDSNASAAYFLPVSYGGEPQIEQSNPVPSSEPTKTTQSRGATINRLLQAPLHMSIVQKGGSLTIKSNMPDGSTTSDEYKAGFQGTISFGNDNTAERSAGWRGPVFIVTTKVNKGSFREDDFALDEDGRLIMATYTKGGKIGKVDIKRVYDRVKN
jgi:hypothetical protein